MSKLGILVVGQSPRPEVEAEFKRLVSGVKIEQRGCLDGLSRAEIEDLKPLPGAPALFTRLPNGEAVTLSKAAVVARGCAQLDALENSGARVVVVLCTGDFPEWSDRRVLLPSLILQSVVFGLQPRGHLGVLSPLASQLVKSRKRWSPKGHRVSVTALSPNASADEALRTGAAFADEPPDMLVFDCVSYTPIIKRALCNALKRPSVLAISVVARSAAEILEGFDAQGG